MMQIKETINRQRAFYKSGKTKDISFRIAQLNKLRIALEKNEEGIQKAMMADFGKCAFEVYTTETAIVINGIKEFERKLRRWARSKIVPKTMATFHAKSTFRLEPFGVVLIMSPWNYPVQLTLAPLIGAMAAGNTAIVKPSRYVPNTVAVLKRYIEENYSNETLSRNEVAQFIGMEPSYFGKIFKNEIGKILPII